MARASHSLFGDQVIVAQIQSVLMEAAIEAVFKKHTEGAAMYISATGRENGFEIVWQLYSNPGLFLCGMITLIQTQFAHFTCIIYRRMPWHA